MSAPVVMCDRCGAQCISSGGGTGYGTTSAGARHCYDCCADADREEMRKRDRITLYLTRDTTKPYPDYTASNWPGSLRIPVRHVSIGRHNIAGKRYTAYFTHEGREWLGVQYGDNTQVLHCRKLKQ